MDILEDKEVVLFDMDGTLVDHFNVIHQCFNYAFSKIGEPPLSYKKVLKSVGGSMPVTMIRLIGEEKAPLAVPLFHRTLQ
jgi:phosphoglycolate phosphatase-like HAD superfamily hydrolase